MNKKRAREYHIKGRSRAFAPSAEAAGETAALELKRFKLVKKLRHQLALKCGSLQVTPPLLAFERWLARAMLGGDVPTPMLPTKDTGGGLGKDLHRAGVAEFSDADAAAAELATSSASLAAKLTNPTVAPVVDDDNRNNPPKVTVEDAGPLLRVKVNDAKPYMTISKAHMVKIRDGGGAGVLPRRVEYHQFVKYGPHSTGSFFIYSRDVHPDASSRAAIKCDHFPERDYVCSSFFSRFVVVEMFDTPRGNSALCTAAIPSEAPRCRRTAPPSTLRSLPPCLPCSRVTRLWGVQVTKPRWGRVLSTS